MQILLLTHYFEPENGAPQRRWSALIERLVAAGHSVHVIAPPPHYPTGTIDEKLPAALRPGGRAVGPHGATVHRVGFLRHDGTILSRTMDHVWVARATVRAAHRLARLGVIAPDVVIATAPGLPTLVAGQVVARRLGVPLVAEMRDAWPDLVSHTPGLSVGRGPVARAKVRVHDLVTGLQRNAAMVVTTTESFARVLIDRGVEQVHVIRNGTSLERYAVVPDTADDHHELRALYMGTIGRSQGLHTVILAASRAKAEGARVAVRIVGYGADLRRLREVNRSVGSPVEILGRVAPSEVFHHYAWADTTIVSLRPWEPFEWTVPSKLYEVMATGKHVTAIVAGEAAEIVTESGAGDVVAPGDVDGIADLWRRLASDRSLVASRAGGREWVAANVDYDVMAERYARLLEAALERSDS